MLSRHSRRSKRSCTNATRRLSVQRGGGSAPAMGGSAAACWAERVASPRAAAIRGQKGGGRRCADKAALRGRVRCRHAPSPSPSPDGARYGWRSPSRTRLAQSRAAQETARASVGEGHAAPNCASPPLSDPSGSHQHVAPVLKKSRIGETPIWRRMARGQTRKLQVPNWTEFNKIPAARRHETTSLLPVSSLIGVLRTRAALIARMTNGFGPGNDPEKLLHTSQALADLSSSTRPGLPPT